METKVDFTKIDYSYTCLNYDYDTTYPCDNHKSCENDYCRCGRIENVRISDINLIDLTEDIYNKIFGDTKNVAIRRDININSLLSKFDIDKYFINRILTLHRLYDDNCWHGDICNGYYGEELDGIFMDVMGSINDDLYFVLENDVVKKIEFLLKKEYGYIDERLVGKNWDLEIVNMDDIVFPNSEHYKSIYTGLEYYGDATYKLPRGILLKSGNKYKVIDGYHRFKNTRESLVEAIVAS